MILEHFDHDLQGGDPSWTVDEWHDYIRSVLVEAHDYYEAQVQDLDPDTFNLLKESS